MYNIYNKSLNEYKSGVLGYSAIAIIFQSGLGSIAVMLINMTGNSVLEIIQFMIITICCMFYNAAVISQQKAKLTFNALLISTVISIFFICLHIL